METSLAEKLFVVLLAAVTLGSVMTLTYTLVTTVPINAPTDTYLHP